MSAYLKSLLMYSLILLFLVFYLVYLHFHRYAFLDNYTTTDFCIIIFSIFLVAYLKINNIKKNTLIFELSNIVMLFCIQRLLLYEEGFISILELLINTLFFYYYSVFIINIFSSLLQKEYFYYKKILKITMLVTALTCLNEKLYSITFLIQCIGAFVTITHIIFTNFKSIKYILRSEYIYIFIILFFTIFPYFIYFLISASTSNILKDFAFYFLLVFPLSLFSIITFSKMNIMSIDKEKKIYIDILAIVIFVFSMLLVRFIFNIDYLLLLLLIIFNTSLFIIYKFLTYLVIKKKVKNSSYLAILQITKEEELKKEFSNYLHDEILQDILAAKNIASSLDDDHNKLIKEILNNLSYSIRYKTEEYNPVLLKSLTFEENLENMIFTVKEKYTHKKMDYNIIFKSNLNLYTPYNKIVYRIVKELVTNSFKHSNGDTIQIIIEQNINELTIIVSDDGKGFNYKLIDASKSTGIISIKEQINILGGTFKIQSNSIQGSRIKIKVQMEGDYSLEYIINR